MATEPDFLSRLTKSNEETTISDKEQTIGPSKMSCIEQTSTWSPNRLTELRKVMKSETTTSRNRARIKYAKMSQKSKEQGG